MNVDGIRGICFQLPGVTEDLKWGDNLCLAVGRKLFLILSLDEVPVTASFKADSEEFEELISRRGFRPAPYFARYHWVMVNDIDILDQPEWESLIRKAYDQTVRKLPRKTRERISSKH